MLGGVPGQEIVLVSKSRSDQRTMNDILEQAVESRAEKGLRVMAISAVSESACYVVFDGPPPHAHGFSG